MAKRQLRYEDFVDRINVDAFEEAIGWEPEDTINDNDVGYCLWPENHAHGDTTGKFGIHREKRIYNCYVCGGGSFLSLAMETQDMDIDQAVKWLYQFCEEDLRTDTEFVDEFLAAFDDVEKRAKSLPYFNERVLDRHDKFLPEFYVKKRRFDREVVGSYGVCYNEALERRAPPRGKFAEDPTYHGPGIIFPHYWKGKLVGWQTRWLDEDRPDWLPKYTNTTDFPKEWTIYGYDQARKAKDPVVVVESAASSLFALSHGYPSVATFGSGVNEAQLRLLKRFSNGVILVPDNDIPKEKGKLSAGWKWRIQLTDYLKRFIDVYHVPAVGDEPGADLGDLTVPALHKLMEQKFMPGIDL